MAAAICCGVNFWRCRHAHCLVSGPGWLALSLLGFAGALIGHSIIGGVEQIAFVGVFALAMVFEGSWRWAHLPNARSLPHR